MHAVLPPDESAWSACSDPQRADQSGKGGYREKGPGKTKHGEVAFPTQVRYDIVFLIRPLIII